MLPWGGSRLAEAIERELHVSRSLAQELLLQVSFDPEQPVAAPEPRATEVEPAAVDADPATAQTEEEQTATLPSQRSMVSSALAPRPVAEGDHDGRARQVAAARDSAIRELQVLARELVSSLQFYQGQPGALPFADVLVAGGTSRLPGFVAELERITRVRVRAADPLARVEVASGIGDRDDLASLAIAIGLGVED